MVDNRAKIIITYIRKVDLMEAKHFSINITDHKAGSFQHNSRLIGYKY